MEPRALHKEHIRSFENYLRTDCRSRIEEIARANERAAHYGVEIHFLAMQNVAPEASKALLDDPRSVFPLLQQAVQNIQETLTDDPKPYLHPRVSHLPSTPTYIKRNVSVLRTRDVDTLISILGTVTRTGSVMLREVTKEFICAKCKYTFEITGDITQRGAFDIPKRCPSEGEKPCWGKNIRPVSDVPPVCREYQEIKIQEKIQNLDVGSIPRSLIVVLTDDLADTVKPGDDVVITGILRRRWNRNLIPDQRADIELMLVACHISSNNEHKSFLHVTAESKKIFASHWECRDISQQLIARNLILKSVCPQIYGMYLLKLIVTLSLIGGVSYTDPSGSRIRGESHLLIVGDPGTAKSQILRYAAKISPRSVLTTGIGTTSAGLTVTAVREPGTGEWMLDAGALVLADGGVCCIDEFDGIKQHDRGAIHEAMEQQTLSVAKAGLVCQLDTRATVLAAVNPKAGRKISTEIGARHPGQSEDLYEESGDDSMPITVGIASPLLSRFDVILTLLDEHNPDWDRQLSSFVLNGYKSLTGDARDEEIWSTDVLRQYMYYIKTNLKPKLSSHSHQILARYYQVERASTRRNSARTSVRLLEALIRLAQAHARLMFREIVTGLDAVFAIAAVEASAASQEVVGGIGALHAPFPTDPCYDFQNYARYILARLGLEDEGIELHEDIDHNSTPPRPGNEGPRNNADTVRLFDDEALLEGDYDSRHEEERGNTEKSDNPRQSAEVNILNGDLDAYEDQLFSCIPDDTEQEDHEDTDSSPSSSGGVRNHGKDNQTGREQDVFRIEVRKKRSSGDAILSLPASSVQENLQTSDHGDTLKRQNRTQ